MNKAEQLVHDEYTRLVTGFRPTFGNVQHIQVAQEIVKLNKIQKEFEAKLEASRELVALRESIRKHKRQIVFLLKK